MRTFVDELDSTQFPKHSRSKRLLVDEFLRVKGHEGTIWAMGDAAVNESGVPLPQLAQVARQQGMYLAKVLSKKTREDEKQFSFFSLGSMAFLDDLKGVYDGSSAGPLKSSDSKSNTTPMLKGFAALVLWRFAYWGRQTSIANKILIPVHWFKTFFFGRDTSRY
jgi:NADH dehydrogenase FAD-containing subunit